MDWLTILIIGGITLVVLVLLIILVRLQYKRVGPNEILIISGGRKNRITLADGSTKDIGFRFKIGGGAFVNPLTQRAEKMVIEVIPVQFKSPVWRTQNGIPIIAEYAAQVSINISDYALYLAITHFLSAGREGIQAVASTILEGRVREVIGTMTVEQILTERKEFTEKVFQGVQTDLNNLGLIMQSFALEDVNDTQGYIEALSKPQVAAAKYEAALDQSEKDKEIAVYTARSKKDGEIARLQADAEIAAKSWENEIKKAELQVNVNQKRAYADMAYELARFKIQQDLTKEQYAVKKVEMQESTKLEEMNIEKKQKELEANVIKPSEARKIQIMAEADAESYRILTESKGKMEAKKAEDSAEAERIKMIGQAEAESLGNRAKAYEKYNQAAIYEMILDKLPELAKNVAEPLSKIEKIVMIESDGKLGTSKITGQVAEVLAQLPEVVQSLTGVDLKKFLKDKLNKDEK
jgi:flotillin